MLFIVSACYEIYTIRNDVVAAVHSGGVSALMERGEWCVALFEGVVRDVYRDDGLVNAERRRRVIQDADELENLRESGDRMLDDFHQQLKFSDY